MKQRNASHEISDDSSIQNTFGSDYRFENVSFDSGFQKLNNGIRDIQRVGLANGWDIGEAIVAIRQSTGWLWADIPFGKFEEVKQFLINNSPNRLKIICPEFAAKVYAAGL